MFNSMGNGSLRNRILKRELSCEGSFINGWNWKIFWYLFDQLLFEIQVTRREPMIDGAWTDTVLQRQTTSDNDWTINHFDRRLGRERPYSIIRDWLAHKDKGSTLAVLETTQYTAAGSGPP